MFITFEGPEGSGKTTQIRALAQHLSAAGYAVLLTREPGGTEIGDQIRQVVHSVTNTAMLPTTEILLYSASRAQLVGQVIRPALAAGQIVLCDRYADSTLAYQGYGHGLELSLLRAITGFATGGLTPDVTLYLDIQVEEGLRRKWAAFQAGESELNRMDRQGLEFHRRVREGYRRMIAEEPARWWVVDAAQPVEAIQREIQERMTRLLQQSGFQESNRETRRQS